MSSEFDQESLLAFFLADASDGVRALSEALNPADDGLPTPRRIHEQFIVAHRIKGAAALYGYAGVARLSERLETLCEKASAIADDEWPRTVGTMREMVRGIQALIQAIGNGEAEDQTVVDRCLTSSADILPAEPSWTVSMPSVGAAAPASVTPVIVAERPVPEELQPVVSSGDILPWRSDDYFLPQLDPEVLSYFVPEAEEYLEALEAGFLRLDKGLHNSELIDQLFRTAHTLKGSAYTVGFQVIGDLVHRVEDFIGSVRSSRLTVMPGQTDVMLRAVDIIHVLMRRDPSTLATTRQRFLSSLSELKHLDQGLDLRAASTGASVGAGIEQSERAPAFEEDRGRVGKQVEGRTGEERDVIRVSYARLERLMNLVGELLIGRGRLEQRLRTLERLSDQVSACKSRMADSVQSFADRHPFALQPVATVQEGQPVIQDASEFDDLGSLELDRYDDSNILARRIGEISADMTEATAELNEAIRRAQEDMDALRQLTGSMRDEIGRARMVPVGTPFTRFRRAIREAARALDKQVLLVTSGEHTEVDAGIVEGLVDPLVHLIRNAVYHGIESPAERVAKGKPALGTIYLRATHRGHSIAIEVEDDGAGLNLETIREKAVALGLVRRDQVQSISDGDARQFIFIPGFSTAAKVGEQAGRGVGLDVVKRAVERMKGHIEVESQPDIGSKFTLSLPLTMLITTALLVRVGGEQYAIALSHIQEVMLPTAMSLVSKADHAALHTEEEVIEVQSLRRILRREPVSVTGAMPVVIVRTATGLLGLAVDELLGRQEIVIKPLGSFKPLAHSQFSGATIDSEGRVVLVVDPSRIDTRQLIQPVVHDAPCAGSSPTVESKMERTEGTRAGVLLIDDSLSVRKFVGRMLESAGYFVDTAVDGDDGIKKASERDYAVVITDLEMPRFNGYEVVQALRACPKTRRMPIIVMTTSAGEKHRRSALDIGADSYVPKPVEERTLLNEVERWVRPILSGFT